LRLLTSTPSGPLPALSANVFDEAIQDCKAAGMDGFVPKPLRIDMLRSALASTAINF
jgi:CheY-like chemotaxis protein